MSISASSVNRDRGADSVIRCAIVRCVAECDTSVVAPLLAVGGRRLARRRADVGGDDAAVRAAAVEPGEPDTELAREPPRDGRGAGATRLRGKSLPGARAARPRSHRPAPGAAAPDARDRRPDACDRLAERGRLAGLDDDLLEHALRLGLVDDRRLVRLDLDQRLSLRDLLTRLLEPPYTVASSIESDRRGIPISSSSTAGLALTSASPGTTQIASHDLVAVVVQAKGGGRVEEDGVARREHDVPNPTVTASRPLSTKPNSRPLWRTSLSAGPDSPPGG